MIKMIQGVYGYKSENGRVVPKTPADEPFSLTKEQETRLVKKKVAAFVKTDEKTKAPANGHPDDETTKGMQKYNDLKKRAKELGIPAVGTAEELAAKIQAAEAKKQQTGESGDNEPDDEEPPILNAVDPE